MGYFLVGEKVFILRSSSNLGSMDLSKAKSRPAYELELEIFNPFRIRTNYTLCILENNFHIKTVRYTLLFLLVFLLSGTTFCQEKIDSLENELKKDLADSVKVQLLVGLSREYQYQDFSKSKQYAAEALAIADENDYAKSRTLAYLNIGAL